MSEKDPEHEHRTHSRRTVTEDWGSRTVERCACGAYRTFDEPHDESPSVEGDFEWSAWKRLIETDRSL